MGGRVGGGVVVKRLCENPSAEDSGWKECRYLFGKVFVRMQEERRWWKI